MASVQNAQLFLGIEGGATRSVALVTDSAGALLSRVEAGPLHLQLQTEPAFLRQLRFFKSKLPQPDAIGIGVAGLRSDSDRQRVLTAAARVWPKVPCVASADLETALAAAHPPSQPVAAQVLVLSGTGSCCFGQLPGGRTAKIGGWGHVLGDKGSAYEIALRTLKAIVYYFDRDQVWPELGARILRRLQLHEPDDLVGWVQGAEKRVIASLALEVFDAWDKHDRIASDILTAAAESLAKDAAACARILVLKTEPVQFVFAGSVLVKQLRFARLVKARLLSLWPNATVSSLEREGAWGAARLAQKAFASKPALGPVGTKPGNGRNRAALARPDLAGALIPEPTGHSPTEQRNPGSMQLDKIPLTQAVRLMLKEEARVPRRLMKHTAQITKCIELIAGALKRGGRLFYVGAGTSGRLGVLDASECPPTFRTLPDQVQGIIAGGVQALWQSVEGAEDDAAAGAAAIAFRNVRSGDVVVGIAASGRTPFVWGALHEAKRRGAGTILVCFNPHLRIARAARPTQVLAVDLGPEILTGSTRLKAGTATKLLLNAFTTLAMVRLGKVVSNLMVDVNPSNVKLRGRAVRIVRELTGVSEAEALAALERTDWVVKSAWRVLQSGMGHDNREASRRHFRRMRA